VPETIDDFRKAGIKVWMLTGDKLETAENIGFSSRMFSNNMCIFRMNTPDKDTTELRLIETL
jgi:phospholipid-translocating ATPase